MLDTTLTQVESKVGTFKEVHVNVPEVATKQLKLRKANGKPRATLSSNWLLAFGFDGSQRVVEESLGPGKGIRVRFAEPSDTKSKKVYTRFYKDRSASPLNPIQGRKERLIEISSEKLITQSLGSDCTHVHIVFKYGVIYFLPLDSRQFELIQDMDTEKKINTLVAMTGGVDCHTLERNGFSVHSVLSYRPQDKRDKSDYTELDSLSALVNSSPSVLVNEDIYKVNPSRLAKLIGDTPITVGHFSLTCEEFSNLKNTKAKHSALEDLSSTIDMFIPMLSILDAVRFPVLVIENVEGFMNHPVNDILTLQLKRRGFDVHQGVFKAQEHGGNSTRKRMYMVATALGFAPFNFPEAQPSKVDVWNDIVIPHWDEIAQRDVTDTKVMKDAIVTGRARIIREGKPLSPTLTRSQGQDPKDAVVVERDNRYYRLPVSVQKAINCISDDFDLDWAPVDKAAQLIGQSICCSLHARIMESVRSHILNAANILKGKATPHFAL